MTAVVPLPDDDDLREAAAELVQSVVRGQQCRSKLAKEAKVKGEALKSDSVTRIQTSWRQKGFTANIEFRILWITMLLLSQKRFQDYQTLLPFIINLTSNTLKI